MRKNLRLLCGESLLARTIAQGKASQLITRLVVSTEDDEIAQEARRCGAEVIKRPMILAQDDTPIILKFQHALAHLEKYSDYKPLIVVILQCTSPLRTVEDIDNTIRLMLETGAESAETMCGDKENGAVYVTHRAVIMEQNRLLGDNCAVYQMTPERSVDIDTAEDLALAEKIMGGQGDHSGVLRELSESGHGAGDDRKRSHKRGRPRKISVT